MAFRANVAMFAITLDSVFKINSHAYYAVATSSTACGLGIACDVCTVGRKHGHSDYFAVKTRFR